MKDKNNNSKNMFLAVELDDDIKQLFAKHLYLLKDKEFLRLEPKRNFHITIGFIPHVAEIDRREVINTFKKLKEQTPFLAQATGGIAFGQYGQILCAKMSPEKKFEDLHKKAGDLLCKATAYKFDDTYESYIPHIKIQSIRKSAGDKEDEIRDRFLRLNFHKLEFKVKNLALMQRSEKHYKVVYRYPLGS